MRIRPKTMRRLLVLFSIISVLSVLIGWAYVVNVRHMNARISAMRAQAMASYQAGDYERAVSQLGQYLDQSKSQESDLDALFAYGKSRINVELPRLQHVYEGIQIFQTFLGSAKPKNPEVPVAKHLLLGLYVQADYNQEAVKLANDILTENPKDVDALKAKARALSNQRKYAEALDASRRLNAIDPANLWAQQFTIVLMQQTKQTDDQLLAYVENLRKQHPDDPRFEVLTAYTYRAINRNDEARKWLHEAASRPAKDPDFVAELTQLLDRSEMFQDSGALIRRAAQGHADPRLRRMLVQRLWEDQNTQELLDQTKALDLATGDSHLLGYRAMALYEAHQYGEAGKIVEALTHRTADGSASAWARALRAKYANPPLKPLELSRELQQAIARDTQNPSLRLMSAEAYLAMGETELAIACLKDAVAMAPAWASPHVLGARIFWETGRYDYALDTANDAVKRAPGRADAETARTLAMFYYVQAAGKDGDYSVVLKKLEESQKNALNAQTLPACVAALARTGQRDAALTQLNAALSANPPLPAGTLLELASISDAQSLGQGEALREQAKKRYGSTPDVAFADARALSHVGKPHDGLKLLLDASKGHENDPQWGMAIAKYRDLINDPEAIKDWAALGDRFADSLPVQSAIIESRTRLQDRAFWQRTIDRLKALTGEQGLVWQAERSRWLLTGPMTEKDKGEAVNLLTEVAHAAPSLPEPHRLLAIALEKVNNIPRAISEWTAAADTSHGDPAITTELIRILVANQRTSEALEYLDKLAKNPGTGADSHRWIAQKYVELGEPARAVALLEADRKAGAPDSRRDAALAELYTQTDKPDEAAKLYQGLLNLPSADATNLEDAANFFAARRQGDEAEKFLTKLLELSLPPGQAEIYQAQFAERWKDPQEAEQHYQAATQAAPKSETAWAALAGFDLRQQKLDDAAAAAEAGIKALPDSNTLAALRAHAAMLKSAGRLADLQPLIELLSREPQDAGAAEMLKAYVDARRASSAPEAIADRVREVAEKYPQSIPLQMESARLYLLAHRYDRAIELARRAQSANPSSPEPPRMLAIIYAANRDFFHAAESAQQWRQRAPLQALEADLLSARIALEQPRREPAKALDLLTPYLNASLSSDQKARVTELYAHALISAGRVDEAAKRLQPLLQDSQWRIAWLDLHSAGFKDVDSAADWIRQVIPSLKSDSQEEQFALARAWYGIGAEFDSAQALLSARDLLKSLTQQPSAGGAVWMVYGLTTQGLGDLTTAESAYRKALALIPKSADLQNDLAYVLWLRGRQQDMLEAQQLAESAIAAVPENASYYDTLARIQARSGMQDAAVRSFRTALQKDPGSIEAMIGLADLLSRDESRRGEVKDLLLQVNRLLPTAPPLSKPLRKQLDGLRSNGGGVVLTGQ